MVSAHRINEQQTGDQPRERLRANGAGALSDSELLAIILRVGVSGSNVLMLAQSLLRQFGGWRGLQRASYEELCATRGLGAAKAAQIKAALEIGRRLAQLPLEERTQITAPGDVAALLMVEMSHLEQEHLRVVILNTRHHIQKIVTVTVGSLNSAGVRVAEVFRDAIRLNAAAIILVHNHPSGDPSPSADDIVLTKQLIEAGKLLDIDVVDHLIIGQGRWVSMRERRLGW